MMPNSPSPDVRTLSATEAEHLYLDLDFPAGGMRPHVVVNTVVTVDGKTALEGRSDAIGSRFDRAVLRRLRAAADAVILGAGTLRAEEIEFRLPPPLLLKRADRGLQPRQVVVVITARGELPVTRRLFQDRMEDVLPVVVAPASVERRVRSQLPDWAELLLAGEDRVDLPEAMARLRDRLDVRSAVLEGGPTLNASMMAHGLIDEVFFTLSPKALGGPALTMIAGAEPLPGGLRNLQLVSALAVGHELYLRYRVSHDKQV